MFLIQRERRATLSTLPLVFLWNTIGPEGGVEAESPG
jgi:hypothetical protein